MKKGYSFLHMVRDSELHWDCPFLNISLSIIVYHYNNIL